MKHRASKTTFPYSRFSPRMYHAQKGFTIVELLISIAIFSLITSFAVTVFVRALRAQRSVVSLMAASDNASLAIEAIAREVRRGRDFSGVNCDGGDGIEFQFVNAEQRAIVYRFDGSERAIMRSEDGTGFFPVTAKNVIVENARFCIRDIDSLGRAVLPRVTMAIQLSAKDRDVANVNTEIHTSVSSRGLNNPVPPSR